MTLLSGVAYIYLDDSIRVCGITYFCFVCVHGQVKCAAGVRSSILPRSATISIIALLVMLEDSKDASYHDLYFVSFVILDFE